MNEDKETLYCLDNVEYKGAVGTGEWKTEHFHIRETYEKISSALTFFKRTYLNISGKTLDFVPCAERKFRHSLRRFLIPCVSYNGNRWGNGMEPKGLEYEGKKWIFSADRTGVPGCSIVESEGAFCTALFAADDEVSKDCSCSLYEVKGEGYTHRLYFSHIEFPICYAEKFRYSEAIRESRRLKAQESLAVGYYVYEGKDCSEIYGYRELFDWLTEFYLPKREAKLAAEEVYDRSFGFIKSLVETKADGTILSNMGFLPDGEHKYGTKDSTFIYRPFGRYEAGWCGQNLSVARLLLKDSLKMGNIENFKLGQGILNSWLSVQYSSGLFPAMYEDRFLADPPPIDTCNLGWTIIRFADCYSLLRENGKEGGKYLLTALAVGDCLLGRYDGAEGFPQTVTTEGRSVNPLGMAGAMLLPGFIRLYHATHDFRYLTAAEKAYRFYYRSYLENEAAAGAALDTYCVDKESAGPMLAAAIELYKITNRKNYLQEAENIAEYLRTWTYFYDVSYGSDTDATKTGFRTSGGTAVSVQHNHLDDWALFYLPYLFQLSELTGNKSWAVLARAHWAYSTQYISDGTFILHGMTRPRGAQNEGFYQCNWSDPKGSLNDWLVAWVKTFQLDALEYMRENGIL